MEKKKLEKKDIKMVSWDELSEEMKDKARKTEFTCMLCGKSHTGMEHDCNASK